MSEFIEMLNNAPNIEMKTKKFPPSLTKYMNMINQLDKTIHQVCFILDGDTMLQSQFSYTCFIRDVIDYRDNKNERKSIFEQICESAMQTSCPEGTDMPDINYNVTRLAMSDKMMKTLRPNQYTFLFVNMEQKEFIKDGRIIKFHSWESFNKEK